MQKVLLNKKANKLQRQKQLVRPFLLYNFLKLSQSEKDKFFDEQVPEVIFRTMRLEGEKKNNSQ